MDSAFQLSWSRCELLVAIVAFACFLNVLPNEYCYDDILIVRDSAKINEPGQWRAIWTTDQWSETRAASPHRDLLYRPIALSSYRLVRAIFGHSALPQHIVNLILHALICVAVVRLCRLLGGTGVRATALRAVPVHISEIRTAHRAVAHGQAALDPLTGGNAALRSSGLLAGLLFAVLPIHTEVVASVVGRADLLATFGVLITLFAHHRLIQAVGMRRVAWSVVGSVCVFVAFGSKESAIGLVAIVVLFDAFWCGRLVRTTRSRSWWSIRTGIRLVYLAFPLVLYLGLRYHALGGNLYQTTPLTKTINILVDAPTVQHSLGVFQLFGMYWSKTIWPAVLSIKYSVNGLRLATSVLDPHVLLGVAATAVLVVASILAWRKGDRRFALLVLVLCVTYVPTSNAIVLMQVFVAERIWYLPSVWIVLLVGMAIGPRLHHRIGWTVFGVLALAMVARCWVRTGEWRDNGTLYAAAYRDQSDAVGPLQLYGQWLIKQGDFSRGSDLLNRALEIDLGLTDAHRTLGLAHLQAGNIRSARWHLQMADMQVPSHPATVAALDRVKDVLSARDAELSELEQQAKEDPRDVQAEVAVVRKLRELGRTRDALLRCEQHESTLDDSAVWHGEFAVTLTLLDHLDEAINHYRRSLDLESGNAQHAVELAMLLLERRSGDDLEEAERWANHAGRLAPDAPSILVCKAELHAVRGDFSEAIRLYGQAIESLPPGSRQRRVFEQRARTLGR